MDKLKQWVGITAVAVLGILAASWFLMISPKHSDAKALKEQAASQDQQNISLEAQLQSLKAQAKALPKQQAKLAAVAAKIPSSSQLPSLIRTITTAADDAGVELVTISPAQPTTVAAPAAATGTATAATATAAAPAPNAAGAAAAGQLDSIGISLNVAGSYFEIAQFMDRLESLTRAFKVTSLNMTPGANPVKPSTATLINTGGSLTASITGTVYMATGRTAGTPPTASLSK